MWYTKHNTQVNVFLREQYKYLSLAMYYLGGVGEDTGDGLGEGFGEVRLGGIGGGISRFGIVGDSNGEFLSRTCKK